MKSLAGVALALGTAACAGSRGEMMMAGPEARPEPREARAARVAGRDPIEAFRLYRKGAEQGDAACAAKFLAFADRKEGTQSQREYARLFVERLLAEGSLKESKAELHRQLALSWSFNAPRNPGKARRHAEATGKAGLAEELVREAGTKGVSGATGKAGGVSVMAEGTAWAGGNDRILEASGVLAFVVNEAGEPVFRGRRLWIRNGNERAVTVSVAAAGVAHRELAPGQEATVELSPGEDPTSGIDLQVRYCWRR